MSRATVAGSQLQFVFVTGILCVLCVFAVRFRISGQSNRLESMAVYEGRVPPWQGLDYSLFFVTDILCVLCVFAVKWVCGENMLWRSGSAIAKMVQNVHAGDQAVELAVVNDDGDVALIERLRQLRQRRLQADGLDALGHRRAHRIAKAS